MMKHIPHCGGAMARYVRANAPEIIGGRKPLIEPKSRFPMRHRCVTLDCAVAHDRRKLVCTVTHARL
jgi:hypothetical protein